MTDTHGGRDVGATVVATATNQPGSVTCMRRMSAPTDAGVERGVDVGASGAAVRFRQGTSGTTTLRGSSNQNRPGPPMRPATSSAAASSPQ